MLVGSRFFPFRNEIWNVFNVQPTWRRAFAVLEDEHRLLLWLPTVISYCTWVVAYLGMLREFIKEAGGLGGVVWSATKSSLRGDQGSDIELTN